MKRLEKELDKALVEALENQPAFLSWVVDQTKFAGRNLVFHSCRSNNPWGPHPFSYPNSETGEIELTRRESETDVLLLVKDEQDRIFGVHFENKRGSGAFTKLQPEMYAQRAAHWVGNSKYGSYADFDTVLVAPLEFEVRNREQASAFGCFISHQAIAEFVPAFVAA